MGSLGPARAVMLIVISQLAVAYLIELLGIFGVERAVVVTQKYHEYRALYIGEKLGLEVIGASSDQEHYGGQMLRDFREFLARNKDFFKAMLKAKPLIGGETIPISGSGLISHGE